jgi:hypothetical protein
MFQNNVNYNKDAENNKKLRQDNINNIISTYNLVQLKSFINGPFVYYTDNNKYIWQLDNISNDNINPKFYKPAPDDYMRIGKTNNMDVSLYGVQPMLLNQ